MDKDTLKALQREILLGFWKIHILYHATEEPVVGQWMLKELRRHGYEVSPGTLYPILHRMEALGWLRSETKNDAASRSRRSFYTTPLGEEILSMALIQVRELMQETRIQDAFPSPEP